MIDYKSLPSTLASMHYVDKSETFPQIYMHEEIGEYKREPAKMKKNEIIIHDARGVSENLDLDVHGFKLLKNQNKPVFDHLNSDQIRGNFYPKCAEIVKKFSGCQHAFAFDHNVRDYNLAKNHSNAYKPVKFAHSDYTEKSAALRLSQLDPEGLYQKFSNFAFFNIWQPLLEPVVDTPLALISHESVDERDLIDISLLYKDRTGKILGIKYNPNHKWTYFSRMTCDEIIMIKCFDSRPQITAKFSVHAAFQNRTDTAKGSPRRSIEVRTIAFFN